MDSEQAAGALKIWVTIFSSALSDGAKQWWRLNRPKAAKAIREDLDRALLLISVQPEVGARARNVT